MSPINSEKRRDTRVIFTRNIDLFIEEKLQGQFLTKNLSMGGLFVESNINISLGEACRLELYEIERCTSHNLIFSATVRRKEKGGIGVKFTRMTEGSFRFLQTMVLYSSDDPAEIAEHFFEKSLAMIFRECNPEKGIYRKIILPSNDGS